jgi:hypothetical protein
MCGAGTRPSYANALPPSDRLNGRKGFTTETRRSRRIKCSQYKVPQPVLKDDSVKIQKQANFITPQPKIAKNLRIMDRQEALDRFYLDDDPVANQKTQAVAAIEPHLFVDYRKRHLPTICDARFAKLEGQTLLISRLEKAGTEMTVNLDCKPNQSFGYFTSMGETHVLSVSSVSPW